MSIKENLNLIFKYKMNDIVWLKREIDNMRSISCLQCCGVGVLYIKEVNREIKCMFCNGNKTVNEPFIQSINCYGFVVGRSICEQMNEIKIDYIIKVNDDNEVEYRGENEIFKSEEEVVNYYK